MQQGLLSFQGNDVMAMTMVMAMVRIARLLLCTKGYSTIFGRSVDGGRQSHAAAVVSGEFLRPRVSGNAGGAGDALRCSARPGEVMERRGDPWIALETMGLWLICTT